MSDTKNSGNDNFGMRFQSNLGEVSSMKTQKDRSWNYGYLALGKVLKVFPKRYTADVEIFHTNDKLHSTNEQEGQHACRIGVSTAGFSDVYKAPYGEIVPICRGNIVLVGFLKNVKEQPVILRVFHDISEEVRSFNFRNILPNYFSEYSNIGDILDYLKVTPIQDFLKIDRFGNIELSSHTKSFFVATESQIIDDGFDYKDLSVKSPVDKTLITPLGNISNLFDTDENGKSYYNFFDDIDTNLSVDTIHVDEKDSKPKKYMAVFRDNYADSLTNWLRFIIDAAKTSFRILKIQQKDNKNTSFDITEDGTVKIRRQLDTRLLFDPKEQQTEINPDQNPCKIWSEIQLQPDGTIRLETIDRTSADPALETGFSSEGSVGADESKDFPHTLIVINPKGGDITVETNSKIKAYAKSGIDMNSKSDINITSEKTINIASLKGVNVTSDKDVNVSSKTTTRVSAVDTVEMFAPDMYLTGAMDMKGSIDMKGQVDVIGNANFTGNHRINHRGAILDGDEDTHGDTNLEFHCNYLVDILESFMIKKLCTDLSLSTVNASAIMGIVNVSTNGFAMNNAAFNGTATNMETAAYGTFIGPDSPYYQALLDYCTPRNLDPSSISVQVDFLKEVLGIDLNSLAGEDDGTIAGTARAISKLWEIFGHRNDLPKDSAAALAISSEFALSEGQISALNNSYAFLTLHVTSANLNSNIGWGSRLRLGNAANTSGLIHENDRVPRQTSGNDGGGTEYDTATIEDALKSINGYFSENLTEQVRALEATFDAQTGLNSSQYAGTNRKTSSGGNNGSGSSGSSTKPASITNIDQYVDRTVKRYIFISCERMLNQLNAAWKYYTYNM